MGARHCRGTCCDKDDNLPQTKTVSLRNEHPDEEVLEKRTAWPMLANPSSPQQTSSVKPVRTRSSKSNTSTGTARPGAAARMIFQLVPGDHAYEEKQLERICSLQPDGSVVMYSVCPPFATTFDGHPGVLPGDTIQQVISSSGHSPTQSSADVVTLLKRAIAQGGRVVLLVATRPEHFDADVYCEGEDWYKLGLLVTIERQHADRIKVQALHMEGLVPNWNKKTPLCSVMPGDWIVHVNDVSSSAQEMANRIYDCHKGENLWLGIQTRPRIPMGAVGPDGSLPLEATGTNARTKDKKKLPTVTRAGSVEWDHMASELPRRQKDEV